MNEQNKPTPNNLSESLSFAGSQILTGKWTATPGIVDKYNPATRRAEVKPTPMAKFVSGKHEDHPLCLDVPVLFPSAGGWTLAVKDIPRGEPVLLIFCRRGIQNFKLTFQNAFPSGGMMDMDSAVAIAGFGSLSITPPAGISLQNADGSVKVDVSETKIELKIGTLGGATFNADGSVQFKNGASINAAGQFVSKNLVNIETHLHHLGIGDTLAPVIPS